MLAVCGRSEGGTAAGPINGPSQWIWGLGAARKRRASLKYTAVGYAIHHTMSVGWALLYEQLLRGRDRSLSVPRTLACAGLTSAVACFVDYKVAPARLRPGFEQQLSRVSLFLVYAAFAGGLALGSKRAPLAAGRLLADGLGRITSGTARQG